MAFQQQQRAATELRIRFGQTFTVNHFYHRVYIDFHRKMLKPLKIVLGNRTLHGRKGISAALRASCVLIVGSICRICASCQVGILLLKVWRGRAGDQGCASGLKLDLVQSRGCSLENDQITFVVVDRKQFAFVVGWNTFFSSFFFISLTKQISGCENKISFKITSESCWKLF